jgi:hypothetical protein
MPACIVAHRLAARFLDVGVSEEEVQASGTLPTAGAAESSKIQGPEKGSGLEGTA